MKYIFSLFLLVGIAACSGSTLPSSSSLRPAGAGSWFKYKTSTIDTTSGQVIRVEYVIDSIIATGLHYAGKSNVSVIMKDDTTDIGYICFEPNGDISIRDTDSSSPSGGGLWSTLPLGSKGTSSSPTFEKSYSTDHFTYDGEETITVANHSFESIRIKWTETWVGSSITSATTMWFAKETGWVVKSDQPVYTINGDKEYGFHTELIDYVLK